MMVSQVRGSLGITLGCLILAGGPGGLMQRSRQFSKSRKFTQDSPIQDGLNLENSTVIAPRNVTLILHQVNLDLPVEQLKLSLVLQP